MKSQILFIDDDPKMLSAVQRTLRHSRARVVVTQSPQEAFDLISRQAFAAIISDQCMPDIEGTRFLEEVRKISPESVRILLTAHPDLQVVADGINRARVSHFVTKPWENEALAAVVENAVTEYELNAEHRKLAAWVGRENAELRDINETLSRHLHAVVENGSNGGILTDLKAPFCTDRSVGSIPSSEADQFRARLSIGEGADPERPPNTYVDAEVISKELIAFLGQLFSRVRRGEDFDLSPVFDFLEKIISSAGCVNSLYDVAHRTDVPIAHDVCKITAIHAFKVGSFALKIGQRLNYSDELMMALGASGFLHDIGMCLLPKDIVKRAKFTESDLIWLQKHPQLGYDILNRLGTSFHWLADIVLQEHEREDGSGYPNGLVGNEIKELAKIIGLADTYLGLMSSRPDRPGLMPAEVVKRITRDYRHVFCKSLLRAMLKELSAFPLQSLVRLNSGAIGRVIQTNAENLFRPRLFILSNPSDANFKGRYELNLIDHPILHIVSIVSDLHSMPM